MFLKGINKKFTHGALKARQQMLINSQFNSKLSGNNTESRPYFTFMDRVKDAVRVPMKHIESYFEPQGQEYLTQRPQTENLYGNTAMVFNAYLTHNAIDMNTWHDMDNTVHSQFGTVDNPVLIFTSDSSWRIVICQGPGIEDDSHAHEKMFYFLREGPMNRCHLCGQCFKLIRLKDEFSEVNDYYSYMFSSLTHFDVKEEDTHIPLHTLFGDRPSPDEFSIPTANVYVHVNPDEADHMLVDPAYKLQKLDEAHEKLHAMFKAYEAVEKQLGNYYQNLPIPTTRNLYSNWYDVEKSIARLDRWFLKIEKFNSRSMIDPDNHERRENRMLERKRDRWTDNYTYFFGGLTEEEQMYRDYFQTDIEQNPEDEVADEFRDEITLAESGEFDFKRYDFQEMAMAHEPHEGFDDIIDQKLFKYKYRMNNDSMHDYFRRMERVTKRFFKRAEHRDPAIEANLAELLEKGERENTVGFHIYKQVMGRTDLSDATIRDNKPFRDYALEEAVLQYKDYYESDAEEQKFFEYLDELPARDRIRFVDIFEDFTIKKSDNKGFVQIPKREYNPELSYFSNVALDLQDFRDRVWPLAKDAARFDSALGHQRRSVHETVSELSENKEAFIKFLKANGITSLDVDSKVDMLSSDEHVLSDDSVHKHVSSSHRDNHSSSSSSSEGTSSTSSEEEIRR